MIKRILNKFKREENLPASPISVRSIGFWHSEEEPQYPDPGAFVDTNWDDSQKQAVIRFLRAGKPVRGWRGKSWCRFHCGIPDTGAEDLSDGYYLWPEGLVHYVEDHNVKLPAEFLDHVSRNKGHREAGLELFQSQKQLEGIDKSWWLAQKGGNPDPVKSYLSPHSTETSPFQVKCTGPRLIKLEDGSYQIVEMRPFGPLLEGFGYALVSKELGEFLSEVINDLQLKQVKIIRRGTGEEWNDYFEIDTNKRYNHKNPGMLDRILLSKDCLWPGEEGWLYVSASLKEKLEARGIPGIYFSEQTLA